MDDVERLKASVEECYAPIALAQVGERTLLSVSLELRNAN